MFAAVQYRARRRLYERPDIYVFGAFYASFVAAFFRSGQRDVTWQWIVSEYRVSIHISA